MKIRWKKIYDKIKIFGFDIKLWEFDGKVKLANNKNNERQWKQNNSLKYTKIKKIRSYNKMWISE